MDTTLTQVLIELKLKETECPPNLNEILEELKTKAIILHSNKVVSLSISVLENPYNKADALELNLELKELEHLLISHE